MPARIKPFGSYVSVGVSLVLGVLIPAKRFTFDDVLRLATGL